MMFTRRVENPNTGQAWDLTIDFTKGGDLPEFLRGLDAQKDELGAYNYLMRFVRRQMVPFVLSPEPIEPSELPSPATQPSDGCTDEQYDKYVRGMWRKR